MDILGDLHLLDCKVEDMNDTILYLNDKIKDLAERVIDLEEQMEESGVKTPVKTPEVSMINGVLHIKLNGCIDEKTLRSGIKLINITP